LNFVRTFQEPEPQTEQGKYRAERGASSVQHAVVQRTGVGIAPNRKAERDTESAEPRWSVCREQVDEIVRDGADDRRADKRIQESSNDRDFAPSSMKNRSLLSGSAYQPPADP
jgi:hypothetical protein